MANKISRRELLKNSVRVGGVGLAGATFPSLMLGKGGSNTKIAIIGAGIAGLTAAEELRNMGFRVTIFEAEQRVGGKIFTLPTPGGPVDLGAVLITRQYKNTIALANRFNIPIAPTPNPPRIFADGRAYTPEGFLSSRYSRGEIAQAAQNYAKVLKRYGFYIRFPVYGIVPKDLSVPFNKFARQNGIEPIAKLVQAVFVGFGYGYPQEDSAAYYLKFLPYLVGVNQSGLQVANGFVFPTGFQSVPNALAQSLGIDIRLGTKVKDIRRNKHGVRIRTIDEGETWFDKVVVACPLTQARKFWIWIGAKKHCLISLSKIDIS